MNDFIPLYLNFDFMELVLANIEILPYDAKNGWFYLECLKWGYPIIWFRSVYKISSCCWFCIHFWIRWELWKTFDSKMIGWTHFMQKTVSDGCALCKKYLDDISVFLHFPLRDSFLHFCHGFDFGSIICVLKKNIFIKSDGDFQQLLCHN